MKSKKSQLRLPKAPLGPPPELPSENRAKLAPPQPQGMRGGVVIIDDMIVPPAAPEHPRKATYPYVHEFMLDEYCDLDLETENRMAKIMAYYDDYPRYVEIVKKYGLQHRLYKDKNEYGDQEKNSGKKKRHSGGRSKKGSGGSFYS